MQDTVWITKTGERLLVRRMGRRHICCCIDLIQRSRRGWRREFLERLKLELQIRDHLGESH
jgi:hypothetical protein